MATKSIFFPFSSKAQRIITTIALGALLSVLMIHQGARVMWGEHYITFFKGIIRNPLQVGAYSPCSVFVAKEITKYVAADKKSGALRVLEVGAGSGVLTTKLEKVLQQRGGSYALDVIEIDHEYAALLQKRFANNPNVTIHCIDATQFKAAAKYDYIITTLPYNVMDTEVVSGILKGYERMIAKGGILSYVEHIGLPALREKILRGSEKELFIEKRNVINNFKDTYLLETATVYRNITPLYVHHLKIG